MFLVSDGGAKTDPIFVHFLFPKATSVPQGNSCVAVVPFPAGPNTTGPPGLATEPGRDQRQGSGMSHAWACAVQQVKYPEQASHGKLLMASCAGRSLTSLLCAMTPPCSRICHRCRWCRVGVRTGRTCAPQHHSPIRGRSLGRIG